MNWKTIRLELARNHDFPDGSRRHGYWFHAPLDADGRFDRETYDRSPWRATAHRFWGSEEEQVGQIVRTGRNRWAFSYEPGTADDESIWSFSDHVLREGEYVTVKDPHGRDHVFRVVRVTASPQ